MAWPRHVPRASNRWRPCFDRRMRMRVRAPETAVGRMTGEGSTSDGSVSCTMRVRSRPIHAPDRSMRRMGRWPVDGSGARLPHGVLNVSRPRRIWMPRTTPLKAGRHLLREARMGTGQVSANSFGPTRRRRSQTRTDVSNLGHCLQHRLDRRRGWVCRLQHGPEAARRTRHVRQPIRSRERRHESSA